MADTSINNWKLLYETGRQALQSRKLQEAEQSFSAALQLAEDFQPGDPRLAATLNALARIYSLQRRYLAAAALLNRLLEVTERTLGPSHVQVAGVLTNLAEMYTHLGAAREELELRERVLAIRRDDPNADAASLQRLEERVIELRTTIDAQDATDDDLDEELGQLPVVRTAEYSAPITTVDERVLAEPRRASVPDESVTRPEAERWMAPVSSPLAASQPTSATIDAPAAVPSKVAGPGAAVATSPAFLNLPPVQRVTPPVMRSVGGPTDHGFADMGRDELRVSPSRRFGSRSSFVSIAVGVAIVAGLLAARNYVAGTDDERESTGSVNLANVAAAPAAAPAAPPVVAPLSAERRTVEQMVAARREEARNALPEAEAYHATRSSTRTGSDSPVRLPSEAAIQRAMRGVDGAVKVIDQQTRAAADSAAAIRVDAPTFNKVRMADAVGGRPPDR